jgi:23S rRNA G2069 N7-methylase RlmK/C1962 C5-methylase RlmI
MLFALDKAAARSLAEQLERGVRRRHVVGVTANPRGLRDYRRLAASALRRVAPGGALLASTNLRRMSAELFRRELIAAARDAGREVARMKTMAPPLDFPPRPGEPWHLKSERIEVS